MKFSTSISKAPVLFLVSLLVSSFFFWGLNLFYENLLDFFYWQESRTLAFTAQAVPEFLEQLKPLRNWRVANLSLDAKAAIAVFYDKTGREKILFEENSQKRLPIASLTKLMSALLSIENYELSDVVELSNLTTRENTVLQQGEKFEIKDLLYFLLISSDNEAGNALAKIMGENSFLALMNQRAFSLGMTKTTFVNPTGLDPDEPSINGNLSTAKDVAILADVTLNHPLIFEILATPEITIYSREKLSAYHLKNTNELLGKRPEILVGKTGWTPQAKGCLAILAQAPKNKGKIIYVILGSENRFREMTKLIDWTKRAYIF